VLLHEIGKEMLIILFVIPAVIWVVCAVLGLILAAFEDWDGKTGREYVLSIVCGLTTPLGNANNVSPVSTMGMIAAGLVGTWALGATGLVSAWSSDTKLLEVYARNLDKMGGAVGADRPFRKLFLVWLQLIIVTPTFLFVIIIMLGCILAALEQWDYSDGVFYLLADISGQPNPLVGVTPGGDAKIFFSEVVSLWLFVFGSAAIGSATLLTLPSATEVVRKCVPRRRVAPEA